MTTVEFKINANKELEYFKKFVNFFGTSKLKKEKMTIEAASPAITESIPILFMIIDNKLNKLWQEVNLNKVRGSYQEVDKILDKLIKIYQTEKRFIPLINKSIEVIKNEQQQNL
jgi:hypothetical protein